MSLTHDLIDEGHLTLVRKAKSQADMVIVTIFINPMQFGNPEVPATFVLQLAAPVSFCSCTTHQEKPIMPGPILGSGKLPPYPRSRLGEAQVSGSYTGFYSNHTGRVC